MQSLKHVLIYIISLQLQNFVLLYLQKVIEVKLRK